jgi:small-conductance mechanosensitive channel
MMVVMAFTVATISAIIFRSFIRSLMKKRQAAGDEDITRLKFIRNSITAVFYTFAIVYIFYHIPSFKTMGTALFAGAGVLAAIIGFASQKAFSNIISGIFILLFRPFRIGDLIEFSGGKTGMVEDITLRHTVMRDFENRRIVIPNSSISDETITNSNLTDEKMKKHIVFSISYDSDIDTAMKIIREEAEAHPFCIDGRSENDVLNNEPIVMTKVIELGDFSVDIRAWVWAMDFEHAFLMKCDLLKSVKERFAKEGIEIPFPYRTLVMKDQSKPLTQALK